MVFPRYLPDVYYQEDSSIDTELSEIRTRVESLESKPEPEDIVNSTYNLQYQAPSGVTVRCSINRVGVVVISSISLTGVNIENNRNANTPIQLPNGREFHNIYDVNLLTRAFAQDFETRQGLECSIRQDLSDNNQWYFQIINRTGSNLTNQTFNAVMTGVALNV